MTEPSGLRARLLEELLGLSIHGLRLEKSTNPELVSDAFSLKLLRKPSDTGDAHDFFDEKSLYLKIYFFKSSTDCEASLALDISMPFLCGPQVSDDSILGFGEDRDSLKGLLGLSLRSFSINNYLCPTLSLVFDGGCRVSFYRASGTALELFYDLSDSCYEY